MTLPYDAPSANELARRKKDACRAAVAMREECARIADKAGRPELGSEMRLKIDLDELIKKWGVLS